MLSQNAKGFFTLIIIFSIVGGSLYSYKAFVEPKISLNGSNVDTLPVLPEEALTTNEITPKIEVFSQNAKVTFETPVVSLGAVRYCLKNDRESCKSVVEPEKVTNHEISINELSESTDYEYKIIIDGVEYPSNETYFSFKTTGQKDFAKIKADFEQAIENQNLDFDYNKDGKVSILDYRIYSSQDQ